MCYTFRLCFRDHLDPTANRALDDIIVDCMQSDFGSASKPLLECCFATMLAHLELFISSYSVEHCIVKKTLAKTTFHGVRLPILLQWGALVRKDFSERNSHQSQTCPWTAWRCMYPSNVAPVEATQALSLQQVVAPVHDLQREVLVLKQTLVQVVSMLRDLQQRPVAAVHSPNKKRNHDEDVPVTKVRSTTGRLCSTVGCLCQPMVDKDNQRLTCFNRRLKLTTLG